MITFDIIEFNIAAYEILSDPEKRKKYDKYGEDAFDPNKQAGQGFEGFHFNFDDFFKGFDDAFKHQGNGGGGQRQGGFGGSFFNFDDLFDDGEGDSFFGNMFGGGHHHHQPKPEPYSFDEMFGGHEPAARHRAPTPQADTQHTQTTNSGTGER